MNIEHLVLSGGGASGFSFYGICRETLEQEYWKYENLKTISCCSVGSIVGTILALKTSWSVKDYWMIEESKMSIFSFSMSSFFNLPFRTGIFDSSSIRNIFSHLFTRLNIPMNITLFQFYVMTNIEVIFTSTDLHQFKPVYISYISHPEWMLMDAIYSSINVPLFFTIYEKNNISYTDGGLTCVYPIQTLLDRKIDPDTILCIGRKSLYLEKNIISSKWYFPSSISFFFHTIIERCVMLSGYTPLKNLIIVHTTFFEYTDLFSIAFFRSTRLRLYTKGRDMAKKYLNGKKLP